MRPPPDINFRAKAEQMHRRAQYAEGRWLSAVRMSDHWFKAWRGLLKHQTTLRNREKAQRQRANRHLREVERLRAERDPLNRIIALGKLFP